MTQSRKGSFQDRQSPSSVLDEIDSHDWICLKCNNLNFSFRKKCNRCKVQSREDNQQLLYADYYYYNHYYYQQTSVHCPQIDHAISISQQKSLSNKRQERQVDPTENMEGENDHLPSVSPLVKKYVSGHDRKNYSKRSVFVWKLFGQQCWSEGESPSVIYPEVSKELFLTDDEETSYDFIRSVQKMII